jgi:hypothetical protein
MTILTVTEGVAAVIGIDVPTVLFSSTEREHVELQHLANEMADRVWKAHDWEVLKTLETLTGDGSAETFSLPSDYGRQIKDAELWSSRIQTPLTHIVSADRWLELDVRSYQFVIGVWTKIGGEIAIKPAMTATETAKYYYISNLIISPASGSDKTAFTIDNDSFRLNERVLKLGMIWQWRANKGLPYGEDLSNYETALGEMISEDKGARMISVGKQRFRRGVRLSYPQAIVP